MPWLVAGSAVISAACLHATSARAAERAAPLAGYDAPASCPDAERWQAALAARVAEEDARLLASQLRVQITRGNGSASAYAGTLVAAGSAEPPRQVRGQTCAEVLEALALIAVLVRPEPALGADSAPAASEGSGWALTPAQAQALAEVEVPAAAPATPSPNARWGLTAFTWLGSASAPEPALDYGLAVHGEWRGSTWQPWLSLGAYTGGTQRARAAGGIAQARFEHLALQAVGCPWRFPRGSYIGLRPCLDIDVGQLSGEGLGVASARRRSWPWLSTGAELRLEWSPLSGLQLDGLLAAVVPLTRPRFYFRPELTSFEVPALGFRAGAALSLSL